MTIEIIKNKHFPLAATITIATWLAIYNLGLPISGNIKLLKSSITYFGLFFIISLPCLFLQYLENKFIWSKILKLTDNMSFFGFSCGLALGVITLGL